MPRPSNTQERRAQIVAGMLKAVAEHGYEKASIQRIAAAAGLSSGLIHYHFTSKQAILLALLEALDARQRARFARYFEAIQAQEPRSEHEAAVMAYIKAHVELDEQADPDAIACWVAIGAEAISQPEVRELYQQMIARDVEILEGLLMAWRGPHPKLKRATAIIFATIQGAYHLGVTSPAVLPAGFAAAGLIELLEAMLPVDVAKERP